MPDQQCIDQGPIVLSNGRVVNFPKGWRLNYVSRQDQPQQINHSLKDSIQTSPSKRKRFRKRPAETTPSSPVETPENNVSSSANFTLSDEQRGVLDLVVNKGKSVFFTGAAGTGKSVLLRAIVHELKSKYDSAVAVTATTGIAACNISGCTIHSFAGIGFGEEPLPVLVKRLENMQTTVDRWLNTQVLVIDEVSMMDGELFDKIEAIARALRMSSEPFGGIQLVLTGDFFQLPPVSKSVIGSVFAFEAHTWRDAVPCTVILQQVFRQKNPAFINVLNEIRLGKLSEPTCNLLRSLSREISTSTLVVPTELYPLRSQVDSSNARRLASLPGQERVFEAKDHGSEQRLEQCLASKKISLKLNAQVMLLKNMDHHLANGSLGIVVGFVGEPGFTDRAHVGSMLLSQRTGSLDMAFKLGFPIVRFAKYQRDIVVEHEKWTVEMPGGQELASRSQIPLTLAWALTIHKSQGQTLDCVRVDLGQVFENGHAYVALSRATSLDGLQVLNFNPSKVRADPRVLSFYSHI